MNILMLSIDFPPTPGGISDHVYELSKSLRTLGNKVSVVTRRHGDECQRETVDGIEIHRLPLRYLALVHGLQLRRFVRKLLPEFQPDIIHIHGMGSLEWYNIDHIPLVYTNHRSDGLNGRQNGDWSRNTTLKRHFKKLDLLLAPSRELLSIPFEIQARKKCIAHGVDGKKHIADPEKRARIRQELNIGNDDLVAISTRPLVDKNGVIYLARAASLLKERQITFIVIGDGPERHRVEAEFKKNCGDRAIFLGEKTDQETADHHSAADFCILPSLTEVSNISGLEAMSASLPLIGTRVGDIPELIAGSKNGYLCEPADPLDIAAKIEILLKKDIGAFGRESRRMVEKRFDWQKIAEQTMAAYGKITTTP